MSSDPTATSTAAPRWTTVNAIDRRVLGVLVEKAKTTPDAYPLTINALVTGCNQKNNRDPVSQYDVDQVETALDRLRAIGAVAAVQGSGRVAKYRHYLYEWLGVDKVELAVMGELLLRGAQTVGELRGRAARMEPIEDLAALRPVLDSLRSKGVLLSLSAEGRGQIVTHALYLPEELDRIRARLSSAHLGANDEPPVRQSPPAAPREHQTHSPAPRSEPADQDSGSSRRELDELRAQLQQLRADYDDLAATVQEHAADLDRLRTVL